MASRVPAETTAIEATRDRLTPAACHPDAPPPPRARPSSHPTSPTHVPALPLDPNPQPLFQPCYVPVYIPEMARL